MGPEVVAVYPQVAAAIDMDLADAAVCQALKVGRQGGSWVVSFRVREWVGTAVVWR